MPTNNNIKMADTLRFVRPTLNKINIMQPDILYLGSQSTARQRLLDFAQIHYKLLSHGSDEIIDEHKNSFEKNVLAIAQHKMQTLILPEKSEISNNRLFALTADTLVKSTRTGEVLGKPRDREDAIRMITLERESPIEVITGCCLEKFEYQENDWKSIQSEHWTTGASVEFYVDPESINRYLDTFPFILSCSGAGMVEDHGLSYLKSIQGSYTAVIGLPLYELRLALKRMGFGFC